MPPSTARQILTCVIERDGDVYTVALLNEAQQLEIPPYRLEWHPTAQISETVRLLGSDHIPETDFSPRLIELGQALYQALFGGAGYAALVRLDQGWRTNESLRLQLLIHPPEIAALPWEAMHDGIQLLSTRSEFTLVRVTDVQRQIEHVEQQGALRILLASASPEDLEALDTQETVKNLQQLLAAAIKEKALRKNQIVLDPLPQATISELRQALLRNYHIFCFAGHGTTDALYFDDGQGDWDAARHTRGKGDAQPLTAQELSHLLEGKPTQLVLLLACRTSAFLDSEQKPIVGFAEELARQANIPAVVAMQTPISDLQANPFAAQFFVALSTYQPVDIAVAEARKVLARQGQLGRDVIAPVLWMQSHSGVLFRRTFDLRSVLMVAVVAVLFILAGFLLNRATSENYARVLAFQAEQELQGVFPERSVPLALLAKREQSDVPEVNQALYTAVSHTFGRRTFPGFHALYSPDGTHILSNYVDPRSLSPATEDQADQQPALQLSDTSTQTVVAVIPLNEGISGGAVFRPDGKQIAILDGDRILGWDVLSHNIAFDIPVTDPQALAYSADATILAVATEHQIMVWRMADMAMLRTIAVPQSRLATIALSPTELQLATLGRDGEVSIWNVADGTVLRHWYAYTEHSFQEHMVLVYSPNGTTILTAGDSRVSEVAQLWDVRSGQREKVVGGTFGYLTSASYSADGKRLAISSTASVEVWDVDTWQRIAQLHGHRYVRLGMSPAEVRFTSLSADGSRLLTSGFDGMVREWEITRPRDPLDIRSLQPHTFVFNHDSTQLASYSGYAAIQIWDVANGSLLQTLPTTSDVDAIAFSPDGTRIAATQSWNHLSSEEQPTRIWSLESGKEIGRSPIHGERISFNPDSTQILVTNSIESDLIDATTGEYLAMFDASTSDKPQFTPSGDGIALIDGRTIFVSRRVTLGQSFALPTDHTSIRTFAISSNGQTLATLGDGTIQIWNMQTHQRIQRITADVGTYRLGNACLSLSPDGLRVASHYQQEVVVWNSITGAVLLRLNRPNTTIDCVAFSPDGRWLASSSDDNVIHLWPLWTEPLSLEQYAYSCCLMRPLDDYDFGQLRSIQPNALQGMAGNLSPTLFILGFVGIYVACWLLLRAARRFGRPLTQLERTSARWKRFWRYMRRMVVMLGCAITIHAGIVGMVMAADARADFSAMLILALTPAAGSVGVAYYLVQERRIHRFRWLRLLIVGTWWCSVAGFLGGGIGAGASWWSWTNEHPLVLGTFSTLWASIKEVPWEQTALIVAVVCLFGVLWAMLFGAVNVLSLLATALWRWAQKSIRWMRVRQSMALLRQVRSS